MTELLSFKFVPATDYVLWTVHVTCEWTIGRMNSMLTNEFIRIELFLYFNDPPWTEGNNMEFLQF